MMYKFQTVNWLYYVDKMYRHINTFKMFFFNDVKLVFYVRFHQKRRRKYIFDYLIKCVIVHLKLSRFILLTLSNFGEIFEIDG